MHVHRSRRVPPASDAQLPIGVVSPALDPAHGRDDARVVRAQGDGCGGNIWGKFRNKKIKLNLNDLLKWFNQSIGYLQTKPQKMPVESMAFTNITYVKKQKNPWIHTSYSLGFN